MPKFPLAASVIICSIRSCWYSPYFGTKLLSVAGSCTARCRQLHDDQLATTCQLGVFAQNNLLPKRVNTVNRPMMEPHNLNSGAMAEKQVREVRLHSAPAASAGSCPDRTARLPGSVKAKSYQTSGSSQGTSASFWGQCHCRTQPIRAANLAGAPRHKQSGWI